MANQSVEIAEKAYDVLSASELETVFEKFYAKLAEWSRTATPSRFLADDNDDVVIIMYHGKDIERSFAQGHSRPW